jgi:hypothetical protein
MAKKSNIFQIVFLMFLLFTFALGAYVYSTMDLKRMIAKSEGMDTIETDEKSINNAKDVPEGCPDVLVQKGTNLYLYDSRLPIEPNKNPIVFNSLEEYEAYIKEQNAAGKNCPILFLQRENNAQGENVYRMRPSPFNPNAGAPAESALLKPYDGKVINELDASRDNGFNQNMYSGFDPQGLFVGRLTEVDVIQQSTENAPISDNPMDSNWGGVLYTQAQVDSGKYKENEITRTNYPTPKGGQNLPIHGPSNPYP